MKCQNNGGDIARFPERCQPDAGRGLPPLDRCRTLSGYPRRGLPQPVTCRRVTKDIGTNECNTNVVHCDNWLSPDMMPGRQPSPRRHVHCGYRPCRELLGGAGAGFGWIPPVAALPCYCNYCNYKMASGSFTWKKAASFHFFSGLLPRHHGIWRSCAFGVHLRHGEGQVRPPYRPPAPCAWLRQLRIPPVPRASQGVF